MAGWVLYAQEIRQKNLYLCNRQKSDGGTCNIFQINDIGLPHSA